MLRLFNVNPGDSETKKTVARRPSPPSRYSFRQPPYTFSYDFGGLKRDPHLEMHTRGG